MAGFKFAGVSMIDCKPELVKKEDIFEQDWDCISRKDAILRKLAVIDKCFEEFTAEMDKFVERLIIYRDDQAEKMKEMRTTLAIALDELSLPAPSHSPRSLPQTTLSYRLNFSPLHRCLRTLLKFHELSDEFPSRVSAASPDSVPIAQSFDENSPQLPCLYRNYLKCFNFHESKWGSLTKLDMHIPNAHECTLAMLSSTKFFCSGGTLNVNRSMQLCKRAYIVEKSGRVARVTDMVEGRYYHGVLFVDSEQSVFVFGGGHASGESLRILTNPQQWSELPRMTTDRSQFNPCLYERLIFLCGGKEASIDVFWLETRRMSRTSVNLPEKSQTITVNFGEDLVVLTRNYIVRLRCREECLEEITSDRKEMSRSWPRSAPVIVNNTIFVLCDHMCMCVTVSEQGVDEIHYFRD